MISPNTIQQIQNRAEILDVVGHFVKLKRRGTNYLGLCPFHNEKTPSFTVSPGKEIFKCFGCGKSGNLISFLMEHEKYGYPEALRWLANRYGIEIEESFATDEQRQQQQQADSLYIINQFAQEWFSEQLLNTEEGQDIGLTYFRERGFNEETIRKFQLGFSPEKRDAFTQAALQKQYNPELLQKAGLIANRNDQWVDNYRGRVIFPIHNHSGKLLGFGARILKSSDKAPKYINTPENEIYVKSRILYGSYFARQSMDKSDECLLVEGYTDVISLHQAGIDNAVASGGTALTPDQLRLIRKYTDNLTILYDGDAAGIKAALRGMDLALEEGLNVRLVLLPDGHDPDSYVRVVGVAAFQEFIRQNKKDIILFQLEVALQDAGSDSIRKSAVVNRIAETIARINKAEDFTRQQDYIRQCADLLKIDEGGLHSLVNKYIRDRVSLIEKKMPFDEAKAFEQNAQEAAKNEYDDTTFQLLFKDDLQEKEIARILLEHGMRPWDADKLVADHIFEELLDESLIDNPAVVNLIHQYRALRQQHAEPVSRTQFVYHPDQELSRFAVSLLQSPYEESPRWRDSTTTYSGYQARLFEQDYEEILRLIQSPGADGLQKYLLIEEDRSLEEVHSAITYLKLRKIKRMILENQQDMEKPHSPEEFRILHQTHIHLKQMEISLTQTMGTVVWK
ncbi:MAG: DNA primase [Bacteroidota bacterium]|jgi:DNA primase